jgi:transcription factor E2F7/8
MVLLIDWIEFTPPFVAAALNDLFGHYVEAWKSWYLDLTRETRS